MPAFRAYLDDGSQLVVEAADPAEARRDARARTTQPIRKIKLDRETVEPRHRAPRLTRRELRGEPHVQHR